MMAETPPTSPPPNPKPGWPSVPSPKGSPDKGGRSPVDAGMRADLAARRRVVVSPRSAALRKQASGLDEEFTKKAKKLKIAHRDDDGDWMIGTVMKKHKITKRTEPTGASKRAKTEFQFSNATQAAFFRLRTKDYGPEVESGPCLRRR